MKKILLFILLLFLTIYSLDDISWGTSYVDSALIEAADFEEDKDSVENWVSRNNDSMNTKFPRWTSFKDSTIDTINVSVIRGNPDVDSISGNPRIDSASIGYLDVDTLASFLSTGAISVDTIKSTSGKVAATITDSGYVSFDSAVSIENNLLSKQSDGNYLGKTYISQEIINISDSEIGKDFIQKGFSYNWQNLALSATGKYQIASASDNQKLFRSSDYGQTWDSISGTDVSSGWKFLAMSSDGKYVTATISGQDSIYRSEDYGVTYTLSLDNVSGVGGAAMSANGKYRTAADWNTDSIYRSEDYGVTWESIYLSDVKYGTALSSSGKIQYALVSGSPRRLAKSVDYGKTWSLAGTLNARSTPNEIVTNSDGKYILGYAGSSDAIMFSNDYGVTVDTLVTGFGLEQTGGIDISSDGRIIVLAIVFDSVFVSTDFGATFSSRFFPASRNWSDIRMSSNAKVINVIAQSNDIMYVSNSSCNISGKLGIDTTSPGDKLHVAGNIRARDSVITTTLSTTNLSASKFTADTLAASSGSGLRIEDDGNNLGIFVEDGGDVGIDTVTPGSKFHVAGSIRARDTVFAPSADIDGGSIITDSLKFSHAGADAINFYKELSLTFTTSGLNPEVNDTLQAVRIGSIVTLFFPEISGTSDATDFSISVSSLVSEGFAPSRLTKDLVRITDNGTEDNGRLWVQQSTTINFYPNSGSNWTASGTKELLATSVTYQIN